MPLDASQELFVHLQIQKKGTLNGLSIANPNLFEFLSSVGYLHRAGSLEFRI
jgi:hypothetical protein